MNHATQRPRRPETIPAWIEIAERYEARLEDWLRGDITDGELVGFSHATWAVCLGAPTPEELSPDDDASLALGRRIAISRERVRVAAEIAWQGPRSGRDYDSVSRRFALSVCLAESPPHGTVSRALKRVMPQRPRCASL